MPERADDERGQLSLSLVEAAVGLVFVLTVAATFGLALPEPGTTEAQLDTYATDVATIVAHERPADGDGPRMADIDDRETFERERETLERRIDELLPDNLLYRMETPWGTLGVEPPASVRTGGATVTIPAGTVTVEVWYG
ncbi:DUF7262 family protein [Halorubrum vacuolatum]|uniref:Uncharacterized protein n=1 Tax=Halorubrum vacuolatum TaxID=63740 RepID=A0A238X4L3_HALVU|nr:hypothetical protein [Halorubrum vacuolatum]SNR53294.1 hypothetical protein SAMN06264855_11316 [Halorubrum vacuolatum]